MAYYTVNIKVFVMERNIKVWNVIKSSISLLSPNIKDLVNDCI